jgi:predicted nucleic acid-binding protein
VQIFFDTSVLVAAYERSHPHHARAMPVVLRVIHGEDTGYISTHSIAEIYATLTRLPVQPRIHPSEAARIIKDNILPHFELVQARKPDYVSAIEVVAGGGWPGGKIYDALLLACAETSGASRVYTFNLADFKLLAGASLQNKISAP